MLLMRYLPRVVEGDRRVIVVDGDIYGAYLRKSSDGDWIQNVSFGAGCELVPVDIGDRRIGDATHGPYRDAGIHVLGYDLLWDDNGDWRISEINAGNIGGLFRIEYLGVPGVTDRFVAWLHADHNRNSSRRGRFSAPTTTLSS
jgi:glutathione synthase/RimK-type ligase-like ATP-grasp enzyme